MGRSAPIFSRISVSEPREDKQQGDSKTESAMMPLDSFFRLDRADRVCECARRINADAHACVKGPAYLTQKEQRKRERNEAESKGETKETYLPDLPAYMCTYASCPGPSSEHDVHVSTAADTQEWMFRLCPVTARSGTG